MKKWIKKHLEDIPAIDGTKKRVAGSPGKHKQCEVCGKEIYVIPYKAKRGQGKYCSKECLGVALSQKILRICEVCGKEFLVKPYRVRDGSAKYCSYDCSNLGRRNRIGQNCIVCGKYFERPASSKKYNLTKLCSVKCSGIWRSETQSGTNCHLWKGGSKKRSAYRNRIWRAEVLKRDNYRCQICQRVGGMLHVHHIYPWAENPDLRFDVDNGITLCIPCHAQQHPEYGNLIMGNYNDN